MMSQLAAILFTLFLALTADAQTQSPAQRKCLGGADKATAKIVDLQWKVASKCLSAAAADKLDAGQSADQCLTADDRGKLAKAVAKAAEADTKLCAEEIPDFGHSSTAIRSAAAVAGALDGFADLFGADLGSAVIPSSANKLAAKCQANVAKASGKALGAMLDEFLACKSAGLKDGTIASAADLDRCLSAIDNDAKGKIAKAGASLASALAPAECSATLFPSTCALATDFRECVIDADRCRICEVVAKANQLSRDCDEFDDALLNLSCGSCADADCDFNATCTSTGPLSYECNCNSGYSGDGTSCEPVNACVTNNGGCDTHAACTPTGPGTSSCACSSGYSGDGLSCTAINSCLTDNGGCDSHATCTPTGPGTSSCACNSGYSGDGITCTVACTPVLDPPTLNGGYVTLKRHRISTGVDTTSNITQPNVPSAQTLDDQRFVLTFNAGAFIDPAACHGEPLQFHWFVTTQSVPGDYRVAGITGYDSPILTINENSLLGGSTEFQFRVVVTSSATPTMPTRSTTYVFAALVTSSQADITIFNACQDGSSATPCSISNLLPPGVQAE